MRFNMGRFLKGFHNAKERLTNAMSVKPKHDDEFKAETAEQLGNYIDEQKKRDFRAEMRKIDLPITYHNKEAAGAFLFSRIDLIDDKKPYAREIKHLLRLRVGNPELWTYEALARYFNTRIDVIKGLERRGKEMVKEAIVKEAGRMVV